VKLLAATALALALCATALGGSTRNVDLLRTLAPQLSKVRSTTKVPVLLPPSLPLLGNYKVYATGYGTKNMFDLELAGAPNCGANACFVAMFQGQRGGKLPGRPSSRAIEVKAASSSPQAVIQSLKGAVSRSTLRA